MIDMTELSVAFTAGILSFVSPCVLPLVPGYLAFISGVSVEGLKKRTSKETLKIIYTSVVFVLGFSTVFILLGVSATAAGKLLAEYKGIISRIAGVVIIVFGLFLIGIIKMPWMSQERRFHIKGSSFNIFGVYLLGAAFAFGWTPCIGPILSSILLYTSTTENLQKGVILLSVYSLGLGIPFIISGALFNRLIGIMAMIKRHYRLVNLVSGGLLIAMGVLLVTERFTIISTWVQRFIPANWQYF